MKNIILFALLLFLSNNLFSQTVIARQDFESSPATPTLSFTNTNGTNSSGTNGGSGRPANANLFVSGSRGWLASNTTSTLIFANQSLSGYTNAFVNFRLAGMSVNGSNGIDAADVVTVSISVDGGTSYSSELTVSGSTANQYWDFSATGTASITYDGNNSPTAFTSSSGAGGISTVTINIPNVNSQVRVKVAMLCNDANERWIIDDLIISGTPSSSPPTKLAITSITPASPTAGSSFSVTVKSKDDSDVDANVVSNTAFTFSNTGGGTIGGTTTGTITAGTNEVTVTGVTLSTAATGVTITATRTSGDVLTAATSSSFTVFAAKPTVASSVIASNINTTSMDVGWTKGSGAGRIVVARLAATNAVAPTTGTAYTPSLTGSFTGSTTTGTGNIVVYNGTGNTVSISNLSTATAYIYDVYEYNGSGVTTNYSVAASSSSTSTFATEPTGQASNVTFSSLLSNGTGFTIGFTAGTGGSGRLVIVRQGSAVDFVPVDGTVYTANSVFTLGSGLGPSEDNKVVYAGNGSSIAVTGLTPNTIYHVAVYEYNGTSTAINYLTSISAAIGNSTTLATEPTANAGTPTFSNTTTTSFDVNWTVASPAPNNYIVVRSTASTPDNPVDGTGYIAGDVIGSSTVVYVGTNLTIAQSSLTPGTEYRYRVFSFNGSGASSNYSLTGVSSGINFTLSLEPTSHPASFTASTGSSTSIKLSFNAANTITNASGYLLLIKTGSAPTGLPVDGVAYANGTTIGDATVAATETNAAAIARTITSLITDNNYYFSIIPFGWDGSNAATRNYYTNATILTANASTTSSISDVIAVPGSSPTSISSLINDAAPLTSTTGIQVWQITIRDGGVGLNDADNLPTIVNGITFSRGSGDATTWSTAIKTAALFDGSTFIATASSIGTNIVFSGLNITVNDNTSKTLSLRISLNSPLGSGDNDGDDFVFQLSQGNFTTLTDGSSSEKASFTAINTTNDSENVIEVIATKLVFVAQPSSTNIGVAISPAVTVKATDVNGNLDLNFTASTTINITTGSTTFKGATSFINAISGVATFNNLIFGIAGTSNKLTASSTGLTSSSESTSFNVIANPTVGQGCCVLLKLLDL